METGYYYYYYWFIDHTAIVTAVKFGANASFVTSCGVDRTVRIFSN